MLNGGQLILNESLQILKVSAEFCDEFLCQPDTVIDQRLENLFSVKDRKGKFTFYNCFSRNLNEFIDITITITINNIDYMTRLRMSKQENHWFAILEKILTDERDLFSELYLKTQRWANVVGNSSEGIAIVDRNSNLVEFNSNFFRIMQFTSAHGILLNEEAINGQNIFTLIEHDLANELQTYFEQAKVKKKRKLCREIEYKQYYLQIELTPIYLIAEGMTGCSLVLKDITSQKQLERAQQEILELNQNLQAENLYIMAGKEKAEVANKAKSAFLAHMSHELRTPLNGILGYAQILRRNSSLTPQQIKGINIIYNSGNHLLNLINDILDHAKIEAGKLELHPTNIHLQNFLKNIVNLIKMQAKKKEIDIQLLADPTLPIGIFADDKRLRQTLLNLLSNAIKFTDRGQVCFKVECRNFPSNDSQLSEQARIRFTVKDNGIGMGPAQLAKIFNPFEQVGDARRQAGGTGLGLNITKQLVETMGGELQVESELGQGSSFWFEVIFPIVEQHSLESQNTSKTIINYEGKRRHILLVDDNENNLSVLQNMLEPLGFDLSFAQNGQEEIELAQKIKPDCILTDLVMPVKDGFEAAKEIRQINELSDIAIIAISASIIDRQQSQIAGCNAFLPKPVDERKLLDLLQKLLNLNWVYQENKNSDSEISESHKSESDLVMPDPEEMNILYELSMLGSMKKIRDRANHLEELDQKYAPLANKLRDLADGFQEKAIVDLIEKNL